MGTHDPRVDAYIAKASDFARPILTTIRERVHAACPDCEETLKWSRPAFMYRGSILCMMSAFKAHCALSFWNGTAVTGGVSDERAMGQFGRLTAVSDLPAPRKFAAYVKQAMALIESGTTVARAVKPPKPRLVTPPDLIAALNKNKKAKATFDGFSPSQRREYVEWITEAKRPETREQRLRQAIEWMAEGKPRNWKYM